jgi:hypothetical protein
MKAVYEGAFRRVEPSQNRIVSRSVWSARSFDRFFLRAQQLKTRSLAPAHSTRLGGDP